MARWTWCVAGLVVAAVGLGPARAAGTAATREEAAVPGENVDLGVVHRIKEEAFARSQVMDHLFRLADVNGPRLTGSPEFRAAADWAVGRLKEWGLADPRLEKWGTFGRGWSLVRFSAAIMAPSRAPLLGVPKAWCAGTGGPVEGDVIAAPVWNEGDEDSVRWDLKKYAARIDEYAAAQRGKLHGKIVLIDPARTIKTPDEGPVERYTDAQLADLLEAPEPHKAAAYTWPLERLPGDSDKARRAFGAGIPQEVMSDYYTRRGQIQDRLNAFLRDEGALAVLTSDSRGPGGLVFAERAGSYESGVPPAPPTVVLESEAYDRMTRLTEHEVPVRIALDLDVRFDDSSPDGVNVVAEIPGGRKRDEIVMMGAHLDSWHAGTGATDNAAGVAVVMEAARILKTLGLPLDRTVRLALWSGEEQGLLGSRGYVKTHFADPVAMTLKPEHARLSGYFNLDNGSGKVRGVYLQGNDAMRPIFAAWLEPFRDLGVTTVTIRNTGGTDHRSFDAVGLPAFQFVQDPLDYMSRTHHSNLDVADHVEASDLMQAAAVMASCVYQAATRPGMLPRKPLPPPLPPRKTGP